MALENGVLHLRDLSQAPRQILQQIMLWHGLEVRSAITTYFDQEHRVLPRLES